MTALTEFSRLSGKLYLEGEFRSSTTGESFEVIDPATEDLLGRIPDSADGEVDEAILAGTGDVSNPTEVEQG